MTISGYCQLVAEEYGERLDATAHDYLDQMTGAAARMDRLIEDLLEYSRAGRSQEPLQPVDLQAIVAEATANLEGLIREHEAQIEVGPMPTVAGDRTQLAQLFQNLLGNAVKFHGDVSPRVRVSAAAEDHGWRFAVEDNGVGIAEEHFERLFHTFQRLHGRAYPGTGIGLAICQKIVDRHGGRIWLDSTVGQGTTFYFTLANRSD